METLNKTINKTVISRVMVSKLLEERSPKSIKAKHIIGYESPHKYSVKGTQEEVIPDIAAIYEDETHLYEIELENKMPVEKWRLLSLCAKKNNGNLYLVVPDFMKDPVKEEIKENDINAGIIYFKTK